MGNDMKKTGVKIKIESRETVQKENTDDHAVVSPPKKRKKSEPAKQDGLSEIKKTFDDFIDHCKKNDNERNAMMREYLNMFAKANKLDKE